MVVAGPGRNSTRTPVSLLSLRVGSESVFMSQSALDVTCRGDLFMDLLVALVLSVIDNQTCPSPVSEPRSTKVEVLK